MTDQPRVAVVGCGHWGKNLVRNFHELGALAAVCDAAPELASSFGLRYDVAALAYNDALADDSIAAIVIAAPAAEHGTLAAAALRAGKHVFVEKPLALDVADAEKVRDQAESAGLTLMVGHLLRYHPAFVRLEKLVQAGALGRLQFVSSTRLNFGKIRREEDILWSFAPHDISMILALVGEEPTSVEATGAAYLSDDIADITTTSLGFADGQRAHVFVSWLHPFKEQKLVVVGEEGMAVFDDGEPWETKLALYRHRIEWVAGVPNPVKADGQAVPLDELEPLGVETRHFLDCIITGSRPRTDGNEGLRVLRVLAKAAESVTSDRGEHAVARAGSFVHPSAVVDEPCDIGLRTKVWHFSHVMATASIGTDCTLGQNVMVGSGVTIGDRCKIQNNVSIFEGVTLEDGVFCGPSCVFTNVSTPRAGVDRRSEFAPTLVRRGATIGANATIVCGTTLGEYSFVAAGAVVTSDVPAYALVAGVPARQIGWVSEAGERLGPDLTCPRTGAKYVEVASDRLEPMGAD